MNKLNLYALIYLSSVSVFCSPSLSSDEKEMPPVSASRAKRKTQSALLTAQLDTCPDELRNLIVSFGDVDAARALMCTNRSLRKDLLGYVAALLGSSTNWRGSVTFQLGSKFPSEMFGCPGYKFVGNVATPDNMSIINPAMITFRGLPSARELKADLPQSAVVRLVRDYCPNDTVREFVAVGLAYGSPLFTGNPGDLMSLAEGGCLYAQKQVMNRMSRDRDRDIAGEVMRLAKLGWSEAQNKVVEGLATGIYGFTQSPDQLMEIANLGWDYAQYLVANGFANGEYGFTQNRDQLMEIANLGWPKARNLVAEGLAEGKYGLTKDPRELKRLADLGSKYAQEQVINRMYVDRDRDIAGEVMTLAKLGWPDAQDLVAYGLARGMHGFTQDHAELKRVADLGWPKAQYLVAYGLASGDGFTQDHAELKRVADLGWPEAQTLVASGLAGGIFGFTRDHAELRRLADLGWPAAQRLVAEGLARGMHGFRQYPAAQLVAEGLAYGMHGFRQYPALKKLACEHLASRQERSPYIEHYLKTLHSPRELLEFVFGVDQ